jgi:hypothetical protein
MLASSAHPQHALLLIECSPLLSVVITGYYYLVGVQAKPPTSEMNVQTDTFVDFANQVSVIFIHCWQLPRQPHIFITSSPPLLILTTSNLTLAQYHRTTATIIRASKLLLLRHATITTPRHLQHLHINAATNSTQRQK